MPKKIFFFLAIIFCLQVTGQNDSKKVMTSFIPKSKAYDIYYPKHFILNEDIEGNVTIYDSTTKLNITISSNLIEKGITDKKLIKQVNIFIKDYFKKELNEQDWNSYKTKFKILIETKFIVNEINWIWYCVVNKQRMVTISINKESLIEDREIDLVKYMIDSLLIFE